MKCVFMSGSNIKRAILYYTNNSLLLIGVCLFCCGYILNVWNTLLVAVLCLLFSNILYCYECLSKRLIFLVFNITFFTFLLSRPTISMLSRKAWWYFDPTAVQFAMNVLFIALISLRIGAVLGEQVLNREVLSRRKIKKSTLYEEDYTRTLRMVSLTFYLLTLTFNLLLSIEQMIYARQYGYAEIYLTFQSKFPYFFSTLSGMMKYGFCLYLATLPPKRQAFIPMALYFISTLPALISGVRNPTVLAGLFLFLYYLLRDNLQDQQRWLGKTERLLVFLTIPVAIVFLGAYNYTRGGNNANMNIWQLFVDFFYRQGVSFDVLCIAFSAIPLLPKVIQKNYTFGPVIEYIFHGSIGQKLYGTMALGSQNSEIRAVYGSSFAHSMSYVAHPEYLSGHGYGSSYLLENYADWGYVGVIIGSIVLGVLLVYMIAIIYRNSLLRTIALLSLLNVFFMPRAEATGWIVFLITLQFWVAIICCYAAAGLLTRKYTGWEMRTK